MPRAKRPVPQKLKGLSTTTPDPYSNQFNLMPLGNLFQSYDLLIKKTNQRFRQLEKEGLENFSPVYSSLKSKGITTNRGNIGFPRAFSKKDIDAGKVSRSDFIKEYKRIYQAYQAKSSSVTKVRELQELQLAQLGIDYDEMMKNKEYYKDELNKFWDLYHELEKEGVFIEYGLKSDVAQEVVQKFQKYHGSVKAPKVIAKNVKNQLDFVKEYSKQIQKSQDYTRQKFFIEKYENDKEFERDEIIRNRQKLKNATDQFLYLLNKKAYGRKAVESSFENDNENRGNLR